MISDPFFKGLEYIGCDIRKGLGVDRIEDAQALRFSDCSVGTLILLEILEHLPDPHKAISEAHRVLRDDGMLVISVPFNLRLHGFPSDYWRFTASGIQMLLSDFQDKIVFSIGPKIKPAFVFAVATKVSTSRFTEDKKRFEKLIKQYFKDSFVRGYISVLKERGKDFFGHMIGRSSLSVDFFDKPKDNIYDTIWRNERNK